MAVPPVGVLGASLRAHTWLSHLDSSTRGWASRLHDHRSGLEAPTTIAPRWSGHRGPVSEAPRIESFGDSPFILRGCTRWRSADLWSASGLAASPTLRTGRPRSARGARGRRLCPRPVCRRKGCAGIPCLDTATNQPRTPRQQATPARAGGLETGRPGDGTATLSPWAAPLPAPPRASAC